MEVDVFLAAAVAVLTAVLGAVGGHIAGIAQGRREGERRGRSDAVREARALPRLADLMPFDGAPDRDLRAAVTAAATPSGYGYCGGLREKVEHHVDHIVPALVRVLECSETDLWMVSRDPAPVRLIVRRRSADLSTLAGAGIGRAVADFPGPTEPRP